MHMEELTGTNTFKAGLGGPDLCPGSLPLNMTSTGAMATLNRPATESVSIIALCSSCKSATRKERQGQIQGVKSFPVL